MPHATDPSADPHLYDPSKRRIVLCFDGTGNHYQGNPSDTNIVKLLEMFDHTKKNQKHYYQPGIGTYSASGSVNPGFFGSINRNISQTMDSGLATSFDEHVMSGYRFLMRYYEPGDYIYVFGFSRGAFTARFLSRMISHVGLLTSGNEEMVAFAYKVYQDYETGLGNDQEEEAEEYMKNFRTAFCVQGSASMEQAEDEESGIKVHFLGLFDTVNSVGTFDVPFGKQPHLPKVKGTAKFVRHAVAIDERRVKFKAALLAQDNDSSSRDQENTKEVWFAGSHCDIGGGWYPQEDPSLKPRPDTFWGKLKQFWESLKAEKTPEKAKNKANKADDTFQLSDIALNWMVEELEDLPDQRLFWSAKKKDFVNRYQKNREQTLIAKKHDSLARGGGMAYRSVLLWRLMEWLPIIRRWEYNPDATDKSKLWQNIYFPLNRGGTRDMPLGSLLHHSVIERLRIGIQDTNITAYKPPNMVTKQCNLGSIDLVGEPKKAKKGSLYFIQASDNNESSLQSREEGQSDRSPNDYVVELREK